MHDTNDDKESGEQAKKKKKNRNMSSWEHERMNTVVRDMSFSSDGKLLASCKMNGSIEVWDTRTGKGLLEFEVTHKDVTSLVFSPDDRYLLTGGYHGFVRLWDMETLVPGSDVGALISPQVLLWDDDSDDDDDSEDGSDISEDVGDDNGKMDVIRSFFLLVVCCCFLSKRPVALHGGTVHACYIHGIYPDLVDETSPSDRQKPLK
jgi:WD40 repeat protein